jgi:hypothetical protein
VLGLAAVEHSRRRQASRLIWLREGDACTKFFHLRANGRHRKNHIACLKTEDGIYKWSHEDKEQVLYSYFQSILDSKESHQATFNWADLNLPQLPEQHRLDEPFTEQEVLMAIDQLPAEKAPGPDGFNGIFYKTCWDIIKPDLIAAFQCLYNQTTGPLPKLNGRSANPSAKERSCCVAW